ncbi:hypothetical protein HDU80_001980 [Chytriomyces hyalinus]|nr:hypothetical protein HDU80_001980 [Chytriomyces hyalinus]
MKTHAKYQVDCEENGSTHATEKERAHGSLEKLQEEHTHETKDDPWNVSFSPKTRDKCAPTLPTMLLRRLAKWMEAATAMESEYFRDTSEKKDEQLAKVVSQMMRDHSLVMQMLEAKAAAATSKYVAEVRGLQLDTLALSHDGYAWQQKCRKLQHEQIDSHVEQHNESVKLHQILKRADSVQRKLHQENQQNLRKTAEKESLMKMELECTHSQMSRLQQIGKGEQIKHDMCPVFSVNAQDFVLQCLSINQDSRLSAVEAAHHPFLGRQCGFVEWQDAMQACVVSGIGAGTSWIWILLKHPLIVFKVVWLATKNGLPKSLKKSPTLLFSKSFVMAASFMSELKPTSSPSANDSQKMNKLTTSPGLRQMSTMVFEQEPN